LARGNWNCQGSRSPIARSLFVVAIDSWAPMSRREAALLPFVSVHKPSDESRSVTASVSIAAWPALCGNNNAGGF
jgi:hypothetical protein